MMAVDSGDSNAVAQFIQKQNLKGKVGASVWDVGLPVVQAIQAGYVTATIDQQAYLQGFDTIMQLFLWNVSGGLMKPTNTDTGLGIVTKDNVTPYLTPSRFEGTSTRKEGAGDAVLDLDSGERVSGRSHLYCCPGGQPAGAAARCAVGGASGPPRLPLSARTDPDRHHDRAVRLLRDQGRVEFHRPAQPELGRRICGTGRRDRDRRGAAARAGRDRPVRRPGLPVLPVGDVLDAPRRSAARARDRDRAPCGLRRRRDQRADHRAPERALVRHHAGNELHPLRGGARRLKQSAGQPDPAERGERASSPSSWGSGSGPRSSG